MKNVIALLLLLSIHCAYSQETRKVCGEFKYYVQNNETLELAQKKAIELAKTQALVKEFGEKISRNQVLVTKESETDYSDVYYESAMTNVNGEWLRDVGEPQITKSVENGLLVINVSICGEARESISSTIVFSSALLRNGVERRFESAEFKAGDQLYALFQSPIDGYLAIYQVDENQTAYCLLPYRNDHSGRVPVEANKEYLFFSASGQNNVDEYVMTCNEELVVNDIYFIFSENDFVKALDSQSDKSLPRYLPFEKFQNWLSARRGDDEKMQVEVKHISIEK